MSMQVAVGVLAFADVTALTFLNGYWLVTLDELELDHLNPADVSRRLNRLVIPEMILHGIYLVLCVLGSAWWILLLNLPMAGYLLRRYIRNEHQLDPTEILRYKDLQLARRESIIKTVFFGLQIIYAMYWMIVSIIAATPDRRSRRKNKKKSN